MKKKICIYIASTLLTRLGDFDILPAYPTAPAGAESTHHHVQQDHQDRSQPRCSPRLVHLGSCAGGSCRSLPVPRRQDRGDQPLRSLDRSRLGRTLLLQQAAAHRSVRPDQDGPHAERDRRASRFHHAGRAGGERSWPRGVPVLR